MKIIRHTARDMRQALRAVREQLGEDAVILSSRRTDEGVEVTAAVDFDASTLEAGGFANAPAAAPIAEISARTAVASRAAPAVASRAALAAAVAPAAVSSTALALTSGRPSKGSRPAVAPEPQIAPEADAIPVYGRPLAYDTEWISAAAREAVAEHVAAPAAPILTAAPEPVIVAPSLSARTEVPVFRGRLSDDPVEEARAASLAPFGSPEGVLPTTDFQAPAATPSATDAMGLELKTLRRMLETQLAHLAWNDLTRRAPIHTEMLRELTEIGITHDLAEHLVRQLPEDTDLTFARRFTIAGLSQYLRVTGDRWLDDGGRVAFAGATGVGKTTTLAKVAVRWVLRHGPRDIALVAGDSIRIGAQDQLQSLAQLLGVPVYTPDTFENLPTLLSGLKERLVLIDTPGTSARDMHLGARLAVLANSASKLETALVLAASTQAGSLEEAVRHFAPANPSCCVLTKLDEAASLGSLLSILIRARLPVSYVSEGQRVPEDLRPARALELVSAAVRLAKARGAAADEDLLRRRFGRTAHGIT
jgi:flagellar biosynthesis protein FlhF